MMHRRLAAAKPARHGRFFRRCRGFAAQIGHDPPTGAGLAVPGNCIGIAQGNDDLPLLERRGVAQRDRRQPDRIDRQHRQIAPRIGSFDRRLMNLSLAGRDVVIFLLAQRMVRGEDQPATIDHYPGSKFRGNEIRIGRLRGSRRRNRPPACRLQRRQRAPDATPGQSLRPNGPSAPERSPRPISPSGR